MTTLKKLKKHIICKMECIHLFLIYRTEFIYGIKIGNIKGIIKNKNVLEIPWENVIPNKLPVFWNV